MNRLILVAATLALLPLSASSAPSNSSRNKTTDACSGLVERRMELARELDMLETSLLQKRSLLSDAAKTETIVEMTLEDEIIDLTADDGRVDQRAKIAQVQELHFEIERLEPQRDDVARKLSRVRSTITQSCPASYATPTPAETPAAR